MAEQQYKCPRGHTFVTENPIIIAVDTDPEYNSGVVCPYCYVNWFRLNVSADIAAQESTKGTISTGHEDLDVWFSSEGDSKENASS